TTNFATNTLVLATPADNPAGITSVNDIGNAKLVVGDPSVPIGAYTLTVLDNLGIEPSSLNIVSKEAKVTDIVTKLELGEADAGFIYTSDAKAAGDKLEAFKLPASAQATATYPIGHVTGSKNAKAAQQWIDLVMSPQGQQVLVRDGFGPAPSS
ncbi:MAG TPA: molybdate ABC transporter substrate-binding protein, partial [Gaiellales bacterium]|nr:molybdate ABC transporter substrate-binding protein [Gaiellales bacterium]